MLQKFVNQQVFFIFVLTFVFGVLLYSVIGFDSSDEICGLLLLILFIYYVFSTKDWELNKGFLITFFIFTFYTGYSIYIKSNSTQGIIFDLVIQLKPYLAFFTVYQMMPKFTKDHKKVLRMISIGAWILLLPIGLIGFYNERFFFNVLEHPNVYAASVIALSMVYLFSSNYTKKDKLIFLVLLSACVLSGRAKAYGFFVMAAFLILYLNKPERLKLNFKTAAITLSMLFVVGFVAKEKIQLYFVDSITGDEKDMAARAILYITSAEILQDYSPFGSGLATFGTHASRVYYSPIYAEYHIDNVWGLSKQMSSYIADTYYPSLAQFGYVGIGLYVLFWIYVLSKAFILLRRTENFSMFIQVILIVGYLAIENIAEATFTGHKGFFMMFLLGLSLSVMKNEVTESKVEQQALD